MLILLIIGRVAEPLVLEITPDLHFIIVFLMGIPFSEQEIIKMKPMEALFGYRVVPLVQVSLFYLMAVSSKIMWQGGNGVQEEAP